MNKANVNKIHMFSDAIFSKKVTACGLGVSKGNLTKITRNPTHLTWGNCNRVKVLKNGS